MGNVVEPGTQVIDSQKDLTPIEVLPTSTYITKIELKNCTSEKWSEIGHTLGQVPQLQELSFIGCQSGDKPFMELPSTSLLCRISIGIHGMNFRVMWHQREDHKQTCCSSQTIIASSGYFLVL